MGVCCGDEVGMCEGVLWRDEVGMCKGVLWRDEVGMCKGVLWRNLFMRGGRIWHICHTHPSTFVDHICPQEKEGNGPDMGFLIVNSMKKQVH